MMITNLTTSSTVTIVTTALIPSIEEVSSSTANASSRISYYQLFQPYYSYYVFLPMFILGVVGNSLCIITFLASKSLRSRSYFVFVLGMTASDIMYLMSLLDYLRLFGLTRTKGGLYLLSVSGFTGFTSTSINLLSVFSEFSSSAFPDGSS